MKGIPYSLREAIEEQVDDFENRKPAELEAREMIDGEIVSVARDLGNELETIYMIDPKKKLLFSNLDRSTGRENSVLILNPEGIRAEVDIRVELILIADRKFADSFFKYPEDAMLFESMILDDTLAKYEAQLDEYIEILKSTLEVMQMAVTKSIQNKHELEQLDSLPFEKKLLMKVLVLIFTLFIFLKSPIKSLKHREKSRDAEKWHYFNMYFFFRFADEIELFEDQFREEFPDSAISEKLSEIRSIFRSKAFAVRNSLRAKNS